MPKRISKVILGVGGGIAAYKSCDLLRRMQERNYDVTVVPTPSALNFVGTATWEALSGKKVTTQVWESVEEVRHVKLAAENDLILTYTRITINFRCMLINSSVFICR